METPQFESFALLLLVYHVYITPSPNLSSSLLCGSHGTTAVAHQAFPFVMATDGAYQCVFLCAMLPVDLGSNN